MARRRKRRGARFRPDQPYALMVVDDRRGETKNQWVVVGRFGSPDDAIDFATDPETEIDLAWAVVRSKDNVPLALGDARNIAWD